MTSNVIRQIASYPIYAAYTVHTQFIKSHAKRNIDLRYPTSLHIIYACLLKLGSTKHGQYYPFSWPDILAPAEDYLIGLGLVFEFNVMYSIDLPPGF